RLDPTICGDEIVGGNEARDRCELSRAESDEDRRLDERDDVDPPDRQVPELEVGNEGECRRDAETQRRMGQLVDEQRYGPLRERAAEVRDRLADPELLEVRAHETSRRISRNWSCCFGASAWIAGSCEMQATRRRRSRIPSAVRRTTRMRLSCVAGRLRTRFRSVSWSTTPARFEGSTPQRLASSLREGVSFASRRQMSFACE